MRYLYLFCCCFVLLQCARPKPESRHGEYLGEALPDSLSLFAENFICTDLRERDAVWMPDGRFLFFTSNRTQLEQQLAAPRNLADIQAALQNAGNGVDDIYWVPLDPVIQMP